MPTRLLSRRFESEIRDRLSSNGFSLEDFTITSSNTSDNVINVNISYNFEDFYFNAVIEAEYTSPIQVVYTPGKIMNTSTEIDLDIDDYLNKLSEWVSYLREDIRNSLLGRETSKNAQQIRELEERIRTQFQENEDVYYTKKEASELMDKLSSLESLFKEKISEEEENKEKLNTELEKLHEEIELLKEQVEYLAKPKWIKSLGIKFVNWSSRNPEAAKQVGRIALQTVLPESIENALPPELLQSPEENK